MKLKNKFSLSAIVLVVIVIAGLSSLFFIAERNLLMKEMRESQINTLKGLAHAGKEFLITKNRIQLINYINQIKDTRALLFAEMIDPDGKILAHTDINFLEKIDNNASTVKARTKDALLLQTYIDDNGQNVSGFSLPVVVNDKRAATAIVGFSKNVIDKIIKDNLRKTGQLISGVAVAALVLGIIGALILAQMMTKPIKKMADGAALIGQGKLDTIIEVKSKDELGSLASDLNRMAEKLRELDQMKQDFVSSVTHELRSPLNSLGMYFDIFFKGQLGEINAEQKEALTFMKDATVRLSKFINDMLDTAKIERGKMEVIPQLFSLDSVINDVVRLYKVQADEKKIVLESELSPDLPDVYADPDRTAQVLNNLVNNAIKFTPESGMVKVNAASKDKNSVEVTVSDTGMGIPEDQFNTVFNKFEQVKVTSRKIKGPKGTGLGLSIVKGIVESQGGKIWVESEVEKGSAFHFTLLVK